MDYENENDDIDIITNKTRKKVIKYLSITEDMVRKANNKLDNKAAAGPDGVPAKLIKKCKYVLAKPFGILWNASMKQGRVPKVFKHAFVIPILKPGKKRTEPESYRPVSLTSHIIKIFER